MNQEVSLQNVVACDLLQGVHILECLSVAVRGEEVLDDLEGKQDLTCPRDVVQKLYVWCIVVSERNAANMKPSIMNDLLVLLTRKDSASRSAPL